MIRWTLVAWLLLAHSAGAHDARTRYLGNEGVLVASGEHKVLMDAFYAESYGEYVLLDEATREAMVRGQPPYDGVDAVLVSHIHGDHFDVAQTLDYLRAQASVQLYAPQQVVAALLARLDDGDPVGRRLHGFDLQPGEASQKRSQTGLRVAAVAIPHSGGAATAAIANLAFRVTLGEHPTIVHLGDATTDVSEFARQQTFWREQPLDVAFPPFWFYLDPAGRQVLDHHIQARQVIGIHVPASAVGHGPAWRERLGGDLFSDPGEERIIPRPAEPAVEKGPGGP